MASTALLAILFSALVSISVVESLCPDQGNITPCYCQETNETTVLECRDIRHARNLERAARNSDGYRYDEVHIKSSVLPYIPRLVMEEMRMKSLFLQDLTLTQLFDDIPYTDTKLAHLNLENIKFENDFSWDALKHTKSLEYLNISHVSVVVLTEEFNDFVTHDLKEVIFAYTGIKEIQRDACKDFRSLVTLAFPHNKLRNIYRHSLPDPFNGTTLDFRNNLLSSIREGLFTNMPHLTTVYFNGNLISQLSEPVEDSRLISLEMIDFSENPIKCDCHLKWIAVLKTRNIIGVCEAPKPLKGKAFKDLTEDDFDCWFMHELFNRTLSRLLD